MIIDKTITHNHDNDSINREVVSVSEWITTLIITLIPVLNIIMLVRWAMTDTGLLPANKVNWARACIIVLSFTLIAGGIIVGILYLLRV